MTAIELNTTGPYPYNIPVLYEYEYEIGTEYSYIPTYNIQYTTYHMVATIHTYIHDTILYITYT